MRKVCIQVEQSWGEQLRRLLVEKELLDAAFPITKKDNLLFFPLRSAITEKQLAKFAHISTKLKLVTKELEPLIRKPSDLATALDGKLPAPLIESIPHSLDIIGDIAIVELDTTMTPYESLIGKAIMEVNSRVTTVYVKEGGITGIRRIRSLRLIAGKAQTTTIHTEYGVRLAIDVTKTYFSPRLGTEHDRVTKMVQPNEVIVDMFTGVGPFALLAAKRQPVTVYAIDINDHAIECLEKSLTLNRLVGKVIPLVGDVRGIVQERLVGMADRVIMNLPHSAISYLDVAAIATKRSGGTIHFYGIASETQSLEMLNAEVLARLAKQDYKATIQRTRIVRPSAPHENQVVLDLRVVPG
jgi:tRNA (guanine37-N1)-methyltransferase